MIDYFEHELCPGKPYFYCTLHKCKLSVDSCVAQYKRQKHSFSKCTGCEIGALHSGEKIAEWLPESLCVRCGNTGRRLIGGQICISCYNRQREVIKGKNGKGFPPVHLRKGFRISVICGKKRLSFEFVTDVAEAIITALKSNPNSVACVATPELPKIQFQCTLFI